jgi:GT2 family glycosyltransferase
MSGFTVVPSRSGITDWLPGLCMNINPVYLETEKFKSDIRIYCEDVEMSLRLQKYGQLQVCSELKYTHYYSQKNRDQLSDIIKFTLGMNYWMASNRYIKLSKIAVVWSAIGICVIDIARSVIKCNKPLQAIGALIFLWHAIQKKILLQRI